MPGTPEPGAPLLLLAFDWGERSIGVATGQTVTGTATACAPLAARDGQPDWGHVEALVRQWQPHRLLVGLPSNMDDTPSAIGARAEKFARRLAGRFGLPVDRVDERLSTRAARERLRLRPGDDRLHGESAVVIAETWLHEHRRCALPVQSGSRPRTDT